MQLFDLLTNLVALGSIKTFLIVPFVLVAAVILFVVGLIFYRRCLRIPQPNEAFIIMKRKKKSKAVAEADITAAPDEAIKAGRTDALDFTITTSPVLVNPMTSRVFPLPLNSRTTEFVVDCHDAEKIAVSVRGVILYKVGDNMPAIAAAARRFLDLSESDMNHSISNLVTGQVRALVGGITIPQLITDRQKLMEEVRSATEEDMNKLGLQIDSLTIQEISDSQGYIDNLSKPQAEKVAQEASIAADQARQEKEQAKQIADLKIAENERNTQVQVAEYRAEQDRAKETASQAGPLARAEAQREVVVKETEIAELQVEMTKKRLDSEVRQTADANLYRSEKEAEAAKVAALAEVEANAARVREIGEAEVAIIASRGQAHAEAVQALGLAEAKALREKADALSENGQAVIDQQIANNMPAIAHELASPLSAIDKMVVLDGPEGVAKGVTGAVVAAGDALEKIKSIGHGRTEPEKEKRTLDDNPYLAKEEVTGANSLEQLSFNLPEFPSGQEESLLQAVSSAATEVGLPSAEEAAAAVEEGFGDAEMGDATEQMLSYLEGKLSGGESILDVIKITREDPRLKAALVQTASDSALTEELLSRVKLPSAGETMLRKFLDSIK